MKKVIKMTKQEFMYHFTYYTENHHIPEDRIREYMEAQLGGIIKITD